MNKTRAAVSAASTVLARKNKMDNVKAPPCAPTAKENSAPPPKKPCCLVVMWASTKCQPASSRPATFLEKSSSPSLTKKPVSSWSTATSLAIPSTERCGKTHAATKSADSPKACLDESRALTPSSSSTKKKSLPTAGRISRMDASW